ncbi:protein FAM200A-like [Prorops nasuta]|uniref:protein FAM200A-like n=1 Tax=Prorops nasuta TaxID=863751 RepID=UPI0034CDABFA
MSSSENSPVSKKTRMSSNPQKRKSSHKKKFQYHWYDLNPSWMKWAKPIPDDSSKFHCLICDKVLNCGYSEIQKHESSSIHVQNAVQFSNRHIPQSSSSSSNSAEFSKEKEFDFLERVNIAEIRLSTFFVEHNIPYIASSAMVNMFKQIGKEPEVLQAITLGRVKLSKIITNVVCREETQSLTETLQNTKFSVFVDETSDLTNEKWFSIMVRYIEPASLQIQTRLLQLINIDARDCSAEKLFSAFNNEMVKKQIPLSQILAIACDNASVMIGRNSSFRTKILEKNANIITFPCICHLSSLVASAACKELPSFPEEFVKKIVNFVSGSPKRTAIFREFQRCFAGKITNLLKHAETRWLTRYKCIDRVLEYWDVLNNFLLEQSSENNMQAYELHQCMQNAETKAYLYFLHFILNKFNTFNAEFQARETKLHLLQPKSVEILIFILRNFMKPALLKFCIAQANFCDINFSKDINIIPLEDINVGYDCEEYLQDQKSKETLTQMQVHDIKKNCLKLLIKAADEIRNRFPIHDEFYKNFTVLDNENSLFNSDRESSAAALLKIGNTFGIKNDIELKKEWFSLFNDESADQKYKWSRLSFDDMWIKISQTKCERKEKYPLLKLLSCIVRSLPHSNAEAERCFSIIPDVKTKKRNRISSATLNAICVIKNYLKCTNHDSITMPISKKHIKLTEKDNLYARSYVENKVTLTIHGYTNDDDDIDGDFDDEVLYDN